MLRALNLGFPWGQRIPMKAARLFFPILLCIALIVSTIEPVLRAQDATKAPQPAKVTCSVTTKVLSAPLRDALGLYRTGHFGESTAAYNAIVSATGPQTVLAYAGLARVYLKQEKTDEAFAAASQAVALTPGKTPAITALGEVYFRQGKLKEAEESFLSPLWACDIDARSYLGLSRIYRATSNYKRANEFVTQAYKLDPLDPDIQRSYMSTLKGSELIEFLRDYLSRETDDDAERRAGMQHELAFLEDQKDQPARTCHLTTKFTSMQTRLETLLDDPRRVRGYGLKVKVNGASGVLLLDTGASGITVDKQIAEKAGLRKIVKDHTGGIGDKAASLGYLAFADSLQIGDWRFESCYVDVVNRHSVLGDDGLIGADVFDDYLVDIDFPATKFKLTQLPPYPDEAPAEATLASESTAEAHPHDRYIAPSMKDYTQIFRFGHTLLIPTYVNNSPPMLFVIDTGSFDNTITPEAARRVTKIRRDDLRVKGLSGEVKEVYSADKADLKFAHFEQDREDLVTFGLDNISHSVGTEVAGLLGFGMLFQLDIKIDYRDGLVDFTYTPPGGAH
jgi:tetratricopeptide (TPR) repeat protein